MKKTIAAILVSVARRLKGPLPPDEKMKILAAVVLRNDALVKHLAAIVGNLIERTADAGDDFDGRANALRHDIEQLSAAARDEVAQMEELRKFFGLNPSA